MPQLNMLPFNPHDPSFQSSFQDQSELPSTSVLGTPNVINLSTISTPDFEIYPATPLNEAPGNQNMLPFSVEIPSSSSIHFQQNHLQPRQTHRARSSSISSLSSIASSISSFDDGWEIEPENPLIHSVGINMSNFNLSSPQLDEGQSASTDMNRVNGGIDVNTFHLRSPHSALDTPQDPSFTGTYDPNQGDLFLVQSQYLAASSQLSRSSSLSSNGSHTNYLEHTFISDDESLQELLESHMSTSLIDPFNYCTQDGSERNQAGHGCSHSSPTPNFQPFDDSICYHTHDQAEYLVPETQLLRFNLSQEMIPSTSDGTPQISQELQFIDFCAELRAGDHSPTGELTGENKDTQPNRPQTEYVCTMPGCSRTFRRKHSLISHQKTHSDDRPFPCDYCNRAFARKHDMLRHRRMHTGQKPYLCEACGIGFYRTDARQRHYHAESKCWAVVMNGQTT